MTSPFVASKPAEGLARFYQDLDARFRAPLMAFFLKRAKDRVEAEDLTQEVFVRLLAQSKPLQMETAAPYIFTIAGNLLRDRARRAYTRRDAVHESLDGPKSGNFSFELAEEIGPERVLLGRERLCVAIEALKELDERTRHILVLFRIEKKKQAEIAKIYGISVKAVEREVAKGSVHLVARLNESLSKS